MKVVLGKRLSQDGKTDLGQYCGTLKRSAGGGIRPVSGTKEVRIGERQDVARAAPTWPSVLSPMGSADCIQLGLLFGRDALPKTHSLSTIKH
jgi:hypothetical protein